jgi:hypothetical protein
MAFTWNIALGLIVLILIPRVLAGRTPQAQESDESLRPQRFHRASFRDDCAYSARSERWDLRR